MLKRQEHFIPALAYHFLTPLYDPVMCTLLRETRFKRHLLALAEQECGRLFAQAGFVQVRQRASYATLFGTLALYEAKKA